MNFKKITLSTIFCALLFVSLSAFAQKKDVKYEVGTSAFVSTQSSLPFWLVSNRNGIIPEDNGGLLFFKLGSEFTPANSKIDFSYAASVVGSQGNNSNLFIDELYTSLKWKTFNFDLGIKHRDTKYDGLSITNGDLLISGNARSYPEIRIGIKEFTPLPFTNKWISVKGSFANGVLLDDRYVDKANIHNKSAFLKIGKTKGLSLILGIDHYVQWGGESPIWGDMGSFKTFIDAVFIRNGSVLLDKNGNASQTESINKGGNHIGQNIMELHYEQKQVQVKSYFRSIFEDNSGMGHHIPEVKDWNFGFFIKLKKGKLISSFMYEHLYSKHQSDEVIDPLNTIEPVVAYDNYFNNGVYRSGWTNYGMTIGNPLFTPRVKENGKTLGIANNAIKAHHLGIAGSIAGLQYKLKATFSKNYGQVYLVNDGGGKNPENYHRTYTVDPAAKQQSYSLELKLPPLRKLPFDLSMGMAYDQGDHLPDNNWGCFISIVRKGIF